jgi:hypothetical protein
LIVPANDAPTIQLKRARNYAMGTSTWSGPLRAGPIKFTTGTTLGQDVADIGEVVLSQDEAITQAGPLADGVYTTQIVIPAGSTITSIQLFVTTAWTGVASTLGIGTTASATALTAAGAVAGGTLGLVAATPAQMRLALQTG